MSAMRSEYSAVLQIRNVIAKVGTSAEIYYLTNARAVASLIAARGTNVGSTSSAVAPKPQTILFPNATSLFCFAASTSKFAKRCLGQSAIFDRKLQLACSEQRTPPHWKAWNGCRAIC